ncbi:MAG: prepilin peptidase [Chloroflexi bacterium]|nr:prepilin peptidase [Chloroflexota bacterium]
MEIVSVAIIGFACGAAFDLVFDRFYSDQAVTGPLYRCGACKTRATPLLMAPVLGFILHLGRCPDCRERLALRTLVLAPGAAGLFVASYLVFDEELGAGLLGGFFATIFLTLTMTDLERRLLPNRIVYPSILIAAALSWGWPDTSVVEILAGGAVAIAIATVLLLISLPFGANAFGFGDIKMIVLIGFVVGVPPVAVGIFIGTLTAGIVAAFLLVTRLRSRRDYIPHGPFLALGAIVAMFWGQDIWDEYRG